MLRTGIVSARIQVNLYRLDDYTSLLQLDKIWTELKSSFMASWKVSRFSMWSEAVSIRIKPADESSHSVSPDPRFHHSLRGGLLVIRMEVKGLDELERQLMALGEKWRRRYCGMPGAKR